MSFLGKKLLILGGAGVHTKIVRSAKKMGIYTIVVDNVIDSPAKKEADESWLISLTDVDKIVEKSQNTGVDAVLNLCVDPAQEPYQRICSRLGLPCYATEELIPLLTEKDIFKKCCIEYGVDVIPDYSYEDIMNDRVDYPVLIKPNHSRGSRGQSICANKESAKEAFAKAISESFDGRAICEKYMFGKQDLATAFFVIDGEPHLVKLGDRHMGAKEDGLDRQVICTRLPSLSCEMFEKKVLERVKNMIRGLGVKFGPVFMQGFIDGDTVRFYDPGIRMPGGDYDLILKKATGFDTVESAILFSLTGDPSSCVGEPKDCYKLNGNIGILLCFSVRKGIINKILGFEELSSFDEVVYYRLMAHVGDEIVDSGDVKQRVGALGALVKNEKNQKGFLKRIYKTVHFEDKFGKDMLVSKYIV